MAYVKINKPSLDYHQFADFHAFTMNNFIRSIMKNGKYKKATKIARLGLLNALKKIHHAFHHKYVFDVYKTFRRMKRTNLSPDTQDRFISQLINKELDYKAGQKVLEVQNKEVTRHSILNDKSLEYYAKLSNQLSINDISLKNFSFANYFNKLISNREFEKYYQQLPQENSNIIDYKTEDIANNFQLKLQHHIFSQEIKFQKIYTKIPEKWYFRTRNLTVFDMIIQAYTMLTGIWYMRKIKVSGRSVLVPSPLRPYRRISTVTQMLLKGIRKLRVESKEYKKAMINSIGSEFYFLVMYYGCQYKHPNITASYVWQLKLQSHKELVANLKNIKKLSYY